MRYQDLTEVRKANLEYFFKRYPNVPKYVVQDFMYKNYKNNPASMDDEMGLWLNDMKWSQQVLTITFDFFDNDTQKLLKPRMAGLKLEFVKDDEERHQIQLDILKKNGPSKEPIIVTKTNGEYELQEGWHRTVQSLLLWPEGYQQNAWVGEE